MVHNIWILKRFWLCFKGSLVHWGVAITQNADFLIMVPYFGGTGQLCFCEYERFSCTVPKLSSFIQVTGWQWLSTQGFRYSEDSGHLGYDTVLENISWHFERPQLLGFGLLELWSWGSEFHWNFSNCQPSSMGFDPRRFESSGGLLCNPLSYNKYFIYHHYS